MIEEQPVLGNSNPDRLDFLPIDPFAAQPHIASAIGGLGGEQAGDDPAYAFRSLDIFPVLGPVRFTLQFHGLTVTAGTLTVRICAFSLHPGTAPVPLRDVAVPLVEIAGNGGTLTVELTSRRNMGYTIEGGVDETDARATALSLSLDPRERQEAPPCPILEKPPAEAPDVPQAEGWVERPELATMRPVTLAQPVSQPMTAAQARDPLVSAWNAALHRRDGDTLERWEDAFILQALHHYGVATDQGAGLGIGRRRRRLPAYLAGRGCSVLVAGLHRDDLPDGDPGLALERLVHADLCAPREFFDAVHLTVFEAGAIPPALTGFDFLWSTDGSSGPGARARFPQMLRDTTRCLRPGGVAVHMLRYSGELAAPPEARSASYGRAEIERMALSLIADGQEVAQLNFAVDVSDRTGGWVADRRIPFGLVVRRIR